MRPGLRQWKRETGSGKETGMAVGSCVAMALCHPGDGKEMQGHCVDTLAASAALAAGRRRRGGGGTACGADSESGFCEAEFEGTEEQDAGHELWAVRGKTLWLLC